jgi:hypothetical protein
MGWSSSTTTLGIDSFALGGGGETHLGVWRRRIRVCRSRFFLRRRYPPRAVSREGGCQASKAGNSGRLRRKTARMAVLEITPADYPPWLRDDEGSRVADLPGWELRWHCTKVCGRCGEVKRLSDFHRLSSAMTGQRAIRQTSPTKSASSHRHATRVWSRTKSSRRRGRSCSRSCSTPSGPRFASLMLPEPLTLARLDAGRLGHYWATAVWRKTRNTAPILHGYWDGRCRARTSDPLLVRQVLSQLS